MEGVFDFRRRAALKVPPHPIISGRDEDYGALLGLVLVLLTFAGWCQHIYACFGEDNWAFLILGAVLSPIGIIHGWSIWLGF